MNKILTYQMDRLPIEINSPPFIPLNTVQRAASDAPTGRKDRLEAFTGNMYMDDLLKASVNEEERFSSH